MSAGRILCWLGQHRLYVIGRCGGSSHHIGCKRCPKQWGMNHSARAFIPWDLELATFHFDTFGYRDSSIATLGAAEGGAETRSHASHGAEKSSPPIGFDRGER